MRRVKEDVRGHAVVMERDMPTRSLIDLLVILRSILYTDDSVMLIIVSRDSSVYLGDISVRRWRAGVEYLLPLAYSISRSPPICTDLNSHPCPSVLGDVRFVPVILSLASPSRFPL